MPKSLSQGESRIVPVKMPDDLKRAATDAAATVGENLSEFVRKSTEERVKKVLKTKARK
jgi:uncharacterized protein (DUF1778 family)